MKDKMIENDFLNLMTYGKPIGTINFELHPEETVEVDPFVIASMKARLKNENLTNVYELADRSFDEFTLMRERNKLKKVVGSLVQLQDAFSSIKSINLVQEEMNFEEVNRDLLYQYSLMLSNEKNVDEYDFYRFFLFGDSLTHKTDRTCGVDIPEEFSIIIQDYCTKHFEHLKITKEAIQMSSDLQSLFKGKKLASKFDNFLQVFYRTNR